MTDAPKRTALFKLAILTFPLQACSSDSNVDEPTYGDSEAFSALRYHITDEVPAVPSGADMQQLARALAIALKSPHVLTSTLSALQSSPEYRLDFYEYVTENTSVRDWLAQEIESRQLERVLDHMRNYSFGMPGMTGTTDLNAYTNAVIVASVATPRPASGSPSVLPGFRIGGDPISVPLLTPFSDPVFVLLPTAKGISSAEELKLIQERGRISDDFERRVFAAEANPDNHSVPVSRTYDECDTHRKPDWDFDFDGFSDKCETEIAARFAPALVAHPSDESLDRETYWAAMPVGDRSLRIFYALGYHRDAGYSGGFSRHDGDSEFIVLSVRNVQGKRWTIDTLTVSAHWRSVGDKTMAVTIFHRTNGHPTVWVSSGKHANYASTRECNYNYKTLDRCTASNAVTDTVEVTHQTNIGGQGMPLINCTWSRKDAQGIECFWTPLRGFLGWQNRGDGSGPTPYGEILELFGFTPLTDRRGDGLLARLRS